MTLQSHQLHVSGGVRGLPVEISSPWEKTVVCHPLFYPESLLKVFQKESLSVFPSLVQKQGAQNQNAGPKGCLQNHRVCEAHKENSCLFIVC